jgi:hypothetical protein
MEQWLAELRPEIVYGSSYSNLHTKVRRARGRADQQVCCSCGGQARDWATIHGRDGEDPEDYQPMCHSCHFIYDGVSRMPGSRRELRRVR